MPNEKTNGNAVSWRWLGGLSTLLLAGIVGWVVSQTGEQWRYISEGQSERATMRAQVNQAGKDIDKIQADMKILANNQADMKNAQIRIEALSTTILDKLNTQFPSR